MKKFLMMLAACAGLFVVAGCSDSPKEVTEKWLSALAEGDLETANKYSTGKVAILNAMIVEGIKEGDSNKEQIEKSLDAVRNAKEEIDGDTAKVYVDEDKDSPVTLVKVDGDWKVDAQK